MSAGLQKRLFILIAITGVIICLFLLLWKAQHGDERIQEANESYLAGEKAKTIAERKDSFNRALKLYLALENDHQPIFGNGKLYYNIGNTYYQLSEYPWAIFYYERAQTLMPREEKVLNNLKNAREKLDLSATYPVNPFAKVFFFHYYLSLPERLQLFFLLSVCALLLCSFYVWYRKSWLKRLLLITFLGLFFVSLSLAYTRYFSPLQGVLIHAVDLRRDAGLQYAKVGDQPLPGGLNVEVLAILDEGKWIKIITPQGGLGYIPQESIRLVQ